MFCGRKRGLILVVSICSSCWEKERRDPIKEEEEEEGGEEEEAGCGAEVGLSFAEFRVIDEMRASNQTGYFCHLD